MEDDPVIEIFSGALWEAEFIKTLLKDSDIDSFIKNSILSTYAYEPVFSSGVKVMIRKSDSEAANSIVTDYMNNKKINDDTENLPG